MRRCWVESGQKGLHLLQTAATAVAAAAAGFAVRKRILRQMRRLHLRIVAVNGNPSTSEESTNQMRSTACFVVDRRHLHHRRDRQCSVAAVVVVVVVAAVDQRHCTQWQVAAVAARKCQKRQFRL